MEQSPIDIVVTSYERSNFTQQCLEAIKKYTITPHRVIVVDNGSSLHTRQILYGLKEAGGIDSLVLLDKNYGLEPAKNFGLSIVTSDYYVDTDNDILCSLPSEGRDWLSRLLELKDKYPEYAAIACTPQVFIGADKNEMFKDSPEILERKFVGGSLRLMKTNAVQAVMGWRNKGDMVTLTRGEEHYICGKLLKRGYKVGYARDIECFHLFGEDNWGYEQGTEHYHRPQWPIPTDQMFGRAENWYTR